MKDPQKTSKVLAILLFATAVSLFAIVLGAVHLVWSRPLHKGISRYLGNVAPNRPISNNYSLSTWQNDR